MQNKFKKAFTLIELLIVIAIIAILTVAFLPGALKAPAKARDAGRVKSINDIAAALESYAAEHNNKYPASATPFCLDETIADLKPLASYFPGDKFPRDSVAQKSCSDAVATDTVTAKTDLYLYAYNSVNYVVAAKMEVKASANSGATMSEITGATTLDDLEIEKDIATGGGYYVRYGPQ